MKKIVFKVRAYIKYFLIFFFFLFWNLIVQPINLDEIWNYGFIHNIYSGLIPYKDFNMVLTPLYPMIMSLFLFVFNSNILWVHIVNGFMIVLILYLIEKVINKDIGLFIMLLCFPLSVTFPSYNLFLLLMFLLVVYLEKQKSNDYLLGLLLGLFILSKQSVGALVCLPSLYYLFKDYKKVLKRIIGVFIPCFIFLIYLIYTESLYNFLDLCLFGLFDFGKSNSNFSIMFIISIVLLFLNLYFIYKDSKNIYNYYLLSFYSILIPLFDLYHLQLYIISFFVVYSIDRKISIRYVNPKLFIYGVLIGVVILTVSFRFDEKIYFPSEIKHFEFRAVNKKYLDYTEAIDSKYNYYKGLGYNIIFLSADGYYFRLINDDEISHIDLINSGNWGHNGGSKLLKYVKNSKNSVIFLDNNEIGTNKQTDQNVLNYVVKNGTVIDEVLSYDIYVLGDKDG